MFSDIHAVLAKCVRKFLLLFFLLPFANSFAQSPGGVSANLNMWLKANTGVSTSSTGTVTTWAEQSGANITGDFSTQGANISMGTQNQPQYVAGAVNFNPQISFSSTIVNSISSNNSFSGLTLMDAYNNTLLQVIKLHTMTSTGVFFKWQYLNTNSERMGCENNPTSNLGKMRFDFRGLTTYTNTNIFNKYYLTNASTNSVNASIRLNGNVDVTNNFNGLAAFAPTQNSRLTLGNEEYGDPYPTSIDIAEVILYKDTLSASDKNKVESYLAVKYGFTLNQNATNANNYTSAAGNVIWDHYANITYDNNITGIGRDDSSALSQNQSKSINTAAIVTVYNGAFNGTNFPLLNTDNTTPFTANNSFLLFGDNNLSTTSDTCFTGNPALLRMKCVWKFQETGTIDTVTLAAAAASLPANIKHLLISTDSIFTPANTTIYRLDTNGGILSKSVVLPATGFFTFASDSIVMHATSNAPVCAGGSLILTGNATAASGTSYQWSGPNGYISTVQSPTINAVTAADSGLYILNGQFSGCPATPDTIAGTILTTPVPSVITPVIYCQYDTATALTANATGQGLLWYTNPPTGAGTSTAPTPATNIPGTTNYYVSQTLNGCQSDSVPVSVIVHPKPTLSFNIADTQVCLFGQDVFTYTGNATNSGTYNWILPPGDTTVSGGGTNILTAAFNTPGMAQVGFNVTDSGCKSNDTTLTIDVVQSPAPIFNFSPDACVTVPDQISYTDPTNNSNDLYYWTFNGASSVTGSGAGPYNIIWDNSGVYSVSLSVVVGSCSSDTTVEAINVHPAPDVHITPPSSNDICIGDSLPFEASTDTVAAYGYQWMPAGDFPINSMSQVYGVIDTPGYISVQAVSNFGCINTDSVFINAHPCCDVFLPNAFTPNATINNVFRIIGKRPQRIINFLIFDRWGKIVYDGPDNKGWDGTYNGVAQDIGTYYYTITYICADGIEYHKKGDVTLVK